MLTLVDADAVRAFCLLIAFAIVSGCASAPEPAPSVAGASVPRNSYPSAARPEAAVSKQPAPSVQSARKPVPVVDTDAQRCIALAMYWEARGEGRSGMLAVGSVVLNRVADSRFPKTACGVVYQGGETPPCQFSWWCDGKSDRPTQHAAWQRSLQLAGDLLADRPADPTGGALFFHNTSIDSPWRRERTARIGNHIFYR